MNEKEKLINILLAIAILILIALNISLFITHNSHLSEEKNVTATNNIELDLNNRTPTTEKQDEQNRREKLASYTERQRIQTYFGEYISFVESQKYEKAYNLLYDRFKENYFPTLESFTEYAKANYSNEMSVKYNDIEREGELYILKVNLINIANNQASNEAQVVIKESDIDDFKISFEVNQ